MTGSAPIVRAGLLAVATLALSAACDKQQPPAASPAPTAPESGAAAPAAPVAAAPTPAAAHPTPAPRAAAPAKGPATEEACVAACAHAQAIALSALPPETDGQVKDEMVKSFATRCVPNCVEVGTAESNACVMRAVTPEDLGACGRLVE